MAKHLERRVGVLEAVAARRTPGSDGRRLAEILEARPDLAGRAASIFREIGRRLEGKPMDGKAIADVLCADRELSWYALPVLDEIVAALE